MKKMFSHVPVGDLEQMQVERVGRGSREFSVALQVGVLRRESLVKCSRKSA